MKVDDAGRLWACYAGGVIYRDATGWHLLSTKDAFAEITYSALKSRANVK